MSYMQFTKDELAAFPLESSPLYGDVMLVYFDGASLFCVVCWPSTSLTNTHIRR